jgi:hypothetical protein
VGRGLHRHPPSRARRSARRTRIILACVKPPDRGPAIALFSETCEARATLATNPEGPVLSFSTDGNIVAEIGVAVIARPLRRRGRTSGSPGLMAIRCSTSESTASRLFDSRAEDPAIEAVTRFAIATQTARTSATYARRAGARAKRLLDTTGCCRSDRPPHRFTRTPTTRASAPSSGRHCHNGRLWRSHGSGLISI